MRALESITKPLPPSDNPIRREDSLPHEREIMSNINNNKWIIGAVIVLAMVGAYIFLAYCFLPSPAYVPYFFSLENLTDFLLYGESNIAKA